MVNRRKIGKAAIIPCVLVLVAVILLIKSIAGWAAAQNGEVTVEQMREFLSGYGWVSSNTPECREIIIPQDFSEVYEQYNQIQKEQGYDLSKYRTDKVLQYTFKILNYCDEKGAVLSNVEAHILVKGGEIIGGDISSAELSGFLAGFAG